VDTPVKRYVTLQVNASSPEINCLIVDVVHDVERSDWNAHTNAKLIVIQINLVLRFYAKLK